MGHVDALEIHRANKFQWTARQYYYGLLQTLRAVALLTANSLEEELIEIDLLAYMPGWFQAEMNELRSVISGETTYPQLEPRTKLAILFSFFEDKFQRDSADQAMTNFRFASQYDQESIEEWGMRITRLQKRVEKHGQTIPFKMFLNKWKTGTNSTFFTTKLREALWPADFTRDPVVTDRYSFKAWMQRFLRKQRERMKDKSEHDRITLIERYRNMADRKGTRTPAPRKRRQLSAPTPIANKDRKGPAPRVTTNNHSKLFRPALTANSANSAEHIDCYNCGKMGHYVKDCTAPKRPRQQRRNTRREQWTRRIKGLVSSFQEEGTAEVDPQIEALVTMLEETSGGLDQDQILDDEDEVIAPVTSVVPDEPTATATEPEVEEELEANRADLQPTTDSDEENYGYDNFALTNYHAEISYESPLANALQEQFIPASECLSMSWPAEFAVLQEHVAERLVCTLRAMANYIGVEYTLSSDQLKWIVLQATWLSIYLRQGVQEVLISLVETGLRQHIT